MFTNFSIALLLLLVLVSKVFVHASCTDRGVDGKDALMNIPSRIQHLVFFDGDESRDVLLHSFKAQLQVDLPNWEDLAPLVSMYRMHNCNDLKTAYFSLLERSGGLPEDVSLEYFLFVLFSVKEAIAQASTCDCMLRLLCGLNSVNRTCSGFYFFVNVINDKIGPIHFFNREIYAHCKSLLAESLRVNEFAIVFAAPTFLHAALRIIGLLFMSLPQLARSLAYFCLIPLLAAPIRIVEVAMIFAPFFGPLIVDMPVPEIVAQLAAGLYAMTWL